MKEKNTKLKKSKFLQFYVGTELFSIPLLIVKEVLPLSKEITPIPKAPKYYSGIVNIRGRVISVIDFSKIIDLPTDSNIDIDNKILMVINMGKITVGLVVTEITRVFNLSSSEILPANDIKHKYDVDDIQGIFYNNDKFTLILNMPRILKIEDLIDDITEVSRKKTTNLQVS